MALKIVALTVIAVHQRLALFMVGKGCQGPTAIRVASCSSCTSGPYASSTFYFILLLTGPLTQVVPASNWMVCLIEPAHPLATKQ